MPAFSRPGEPEITAMLISLSDDEHVVIGIEISKAALRRHRRLLEQLLALAAAPPSGAGG